MLEQQRFPVATSVSALLCFGSLAACSSDHGVWPGPEDNPKTVRDTTGVEFGWECTDACRPYPLESTPPPVDCANGDPGYSYFAGRFISLCSICRIDIGASGGWSTYDSLCRALACGAMSECPQLYSFGEGYTYECVNGLCQNTDRERFSSDSYDVSDVWILCLADVPRELTESPFSPKLEEAVEPVSETCTSWDEPCDGVPESCRQP